MGKISERFAVALPGAGFRPPHSLVVAGVGAAPRSGDRGRPRWQKGLFFGAVLAIVRWQFFPPDRS